MMVVGVKFDGGLNWWSRSAFLTAKLFIHVQYYNLIYACMVICCIPMESMQLSKLQFPPISISAVVLHLFICLVSKPSHFLSTTLKAVRAWRQAYVYISTSNNNFNYWPLENTLILVESILLLSQSQFFQ